MDDTKKAAVIAAVMGYIRNEEDTCRAQLASAAANRPAIAPAGPQNWWGISGRQSMMQLRNLMQLRSMTRFS